MSKVQVKPLRSFEHNGAIVRRRSGAIAVEGWQADQMIAMGLVESVGKEPTQESAAESKPSRKPKTSGD